MKAVTSQGIIKVKGVFIDEIPFNGGTLKIEPRFRPMENLVTEAEILAPPKQTHDYPNDLVEGDRVRIFYNAIDPDAEPPVYTEGEYGIYRIDAMHILYRIVGESAEMQMGWVACEALPLKIPEGKRYDKINNVAYWIDKVTGLAEKVDFTPLQRQAFVRHVGIPIPGLEPLSPGDHICMLPECEFDNDGRSTIEGKRYWFVHQGDIIAKVC
jgi:hypothetical protein